MDLYILKKELDQYDISLSIQNSHFAKEIKYPLLYDSSSSFSESETKQTICVTDAKELPDKCRKFPFRNILCSGKPKADWLTDDNGHNILYTSEPISFVQLFNHLQRIFEKYTNWENQLQDAVEQGLPLKKIAQLSSPYINNPIYLEGPSFFVFFHVIPPQTPDNKAALESYFLNYQLEENAYLSAEEINTLLTDHKFNNYVDIDYPSIHTVTQYNFRTLFFNIRINGTTVAKLCVDEITHKFTEYDFSIILILGKYLSKAIIKKDITNLNRPRNLDKVLEKLLKHQLVDEKKIISVLSHYMWKIEDAYFCMCIMRKESENTNHSLKTEALSLASALPSDCYTILEQQLIFVFNLTQCKQSREEILTLAKPLLRDKLLVAGISSVYQDFKELYYYYKQACAAYQIGVRNDPTYWYFEYENYITDYFIQKCSEKQIVTALIPEGLKRLMEYDKQNHTAYTSLMKIELECNMNIAKTIRTAYIHRNTCLYRLKRIVEISHLNPDDYKTRLNLMISYEILEKNGMLPKQQL